VIPTDLTQEEQPINYRPVFVSDQVMPPFGPITHSATDVVEISIVAEDPNKDDSLKARLFRLGTAPGQLDLVDEIGKLDQDTAMPLVRRGQFHPSRLCSLFPSGVNDLFVVLTDGLWSDMNGVPGPQVTGGLTDENHWELTCK
jgi:hypothetical protein